MPVNLKKLALVFALGLTPLLATAEVADKHAPHTHHTIQEAKMIWLGSVKVGDIIKLPHNRSLFQIVASAPGVGGDLVYAPSTDNSSLHFVGYAVPVKPVELNGAWLGSVKPGDEVRLKDNRRTFQVTKESDRGELIFAPSADSDSVYLVGRAVPSLNSR
jgi:hypothetical protein